MTQELATQPMHAETLSKVLLDGNLASLNAAQRVEYMTRVCESLGLNPLTKPFEFISLNGKLVMYAKRDCTEQLRKIHGVSISIMGREVVEGVYVVTARAQDKTGRQDESIGAVPIDKVQGENRANAMMKAETKAKRRVTLSVCGLGMLDETEAEPLAYTPPRTVVESPERIAGTHGEAPQDRPLSSSVATTAPVASVPATSAPAPSKPRTAADVKPLGGPITPAQVKLVHVLKGQVGGVFSGDGSDPRDKWSKTLGVYRKEDGSRCAHTNELSRDQGFAPRGSDAGLHREARGPRSGRSGPGRRREVHVEHG